MDNYINEGLPNQRTMTYGASLTPENAYDETYNTYSLKVEEMHQMGNSYSTIHLAQWKQPYSGWRYIIASNYSSSVDSLKRAQQDLKDALESGDTEEIKDAEDDVADAEKDKKIQYEKYRAITTLGKEVKSKASSETTDTSTNDSSSGKDAVDTSTNSTQEQASLSVDSSVPSSADVVSNTTPNAGANGSTSDNSQAGTNINSSEVVRDTETLGTGAGLDKNTFMNKGVVAPFIRINDHYFKEDEIVEFYIESGYFKNYHDYETFKYPKTGFVPTFHLIVNTSAPDLLKQNQIKSGDKAAIFFSNGGGPIKSYRADYIINSVVSSDKPSEVTDIAMTYIIDGELFIPNLRNQLERFNFNGSSRDAVLDAAKRLGLSFFFCDPDDTQDYQGWVCANNLHDYVLDVTAHAWKEFNAFFDSWIDPRYGLSFINMNKMLGEDGLDEQLDVIPFVNMINNSYGVEGTKATKTEKQKKLHPQPLAKLISNIPRDDESVSPFYAVKWNILNRASEIAKAIGVNAQQLQTIDNPGVDTENTDLTMNYSIPTNQTKLQNGFFVLIGPGVNLTYTQADQIDPNMSFVKNSYTVSGGSINETMSDGDSETMQSTGNNMFSSGNTNKFYDVGWEHNMRSNLQLQKQITQVDLRGLNLAVMRGEKIPAMFMDNDKVQASARTNNFTGSEAQNALYEMACGWYIIDGLMWHWGVDENNKGTTLWTTKLNLVRREWPIPGRKATTKNSNEVQVEHPIDSTAGMNKSDADTSLTKDEIQNEEALNTNAETALTVTDDDRTSTSEVPLTGLREELKTLYSYIKGSCKIKIVSAKRWAVNEQGQRTEGNAFVQKNGLYKCVNAKGEIMYFKSSNSRHLYGEAFDIINDSGQDFNEIMTKCVLVDESIIQLMAQYGIAACIEQTTDDAGAKVKHYHFGTEESIQANFWNSVQAALPNMSSTTLRLVKSASANRQKYALSETKNTVVDENAIGDAANQSNDSVKAGEIKRYSIKDNAKSKYEDRAYLEYKSSDGSIDAHSSSISEVSDDELLVDLTNAFNKKSPTDAQKQAFNVTKSNYRNSSQYMSEAEMTALIEKKYAE